MSISGLVTKVPRPATRSSSPWATRASIACRTVIRATPNCSARSRSDGAGVPGSALTITDRTYSRTSTCLRPRLPPPRGECSSTRELLRQVVARKPSQPVVADTGARSRPGIPRRAHSVPMASEHVEPGRPARRNHGREHPRDRGQEQEAAEQRPRDGQLGQTVLLQGGAPSRRRTAHPARCRARRPGRRPPPTPGGSSCAAAGGSTPTARSSPTSRVRSITERLSVLITPRIAMITESPSSP